MEFKVGDRVAIHRVFACADKDVPGTVMRVGAPCLHIKRDDGKEGMGKDGTWLAYPAESIDGQPAVILLSTSTASVLTSEDEKHIAGLSPEVIDQDAFDEFMRGL